MSTDAIGVWTISLFKSGWKCLKHQSAGDGALCPRCVIGLIDTDTALLEACRERLMRVQGEVSMIDASPAGSLNASCKLLALDILGATLARLNERLEVKE